jgi:hypothetical protein
MSCAGEYGSFSVSRQRGLATATTSAAFFAQRELVEGHLPADAAPTRRYTSPVAPAPGFVFLVCDASHGCRIGAYRVRPDRHLHNCRGVGMRANASSYLPVCSWMGSAGHSAAGYRSLSPWPSGQPHTNPCLQPSPAYRSRWKRARTVMLRGGSSCYQEPRPGFVI